ncbi:MAG: mechanosensitive ion channel family protein [Rhodocyclaceae bacterium]|nr:mechanosensitive ion channel family protein [Rhodocyclaceae bacterium]
MTALQHLLDHNDTGAFLLASLAAVVGFLALSLLRRLVRSRLVALAAGTTFKWDDLVVDVLGSTRNWALGGVALLLALNYLDLPAAVATRTTQAVMALVFLQAGLWASRAVRFWLAWRLACRDAEDDGASATALAVAGFTIRLALWSIVLILILDQFGFDVTTLIASLGVGGVAVALAVQNILGDLFASLSIALDKPFVIGDFVVVGDVAGTVEHVGLKTTRVRSLSGEQVVMANGDLLASRIRNFKRLQERRISFAFGVPYGTPADTLEAIPGLLRKIVEGIDDARFDRAHFRALGPSSLDFEVVYFVTTADYDRFMDVQQAINLAMVRRFAERDIGFAHPTRTVHVASLPGPPQAAN